MANNAMKTRIINIRQAIPTHDMTYTAYALFKVQKVTQA
ncbi:hypothetical protein [Vibrio phage JSF12]|uniref:Uncharacterized protein n=2 Tax=Jesfedecavirus TaxID=2560156 RepID=A0A2D0Z8P4_9CAUD|nr:hypothetical protein FDI98_gp014 [Vibrio phage JSF10]YP_009794745.1 hypothetical protein HOS35_gp062 [Vibrio phage JSF12]ASV43518.1 hypothetical protein [Vibrio phage JSF10]ASV43580.1 hypothetical protein [Vibrio phage JSF12]